MKKLFTVGLVAASPLISFADALTERVIKDFASVDGRAAVHYALPAMSEVQRLPDTYPVDGEAGGTVRVFAAHGEFEPAAFGVFGLEELGKVSFDIGKLTTSDGKVFPADLLDLRLVKSWYQNRNGWFSYFGDTGFKLCPELLLHDEDLIRCDETKSANYAKVVGKDGTVSEVWINPPRQMDSHVSFEAPWRKQPVFQSMRPGFHDALTMQPATVAKGRFTTLFLTAHVTDDVHAGTYTGEIVLNKPAKQADDPAILSIPVSIEVLPYTLPHPKSFAEPQRDFLVSFYSYISIGLIGEYNGGDVELARRQLAAVLKNQAEHNQPMHMLRGNLNGEFFFTVKTMLEAGMRPDVFQGGVCPDNLAKSIAEHEGYARRAADELDRRYGHHNLYMMYGDEPGQKWLEAARPVYRAYQKAGLKFCIAGSDNVLNKAGYLYDWHNLAKDATDDASTRKWNLIGDNNVAWYAQQHVGCENPAFNRRQNGLGAYLAGYSALCNYAHHFGLYNDDSTCYKPMVFAYGTDNGVLDTLQWEGFREGIDDIRYATLLVELARKAKKSDDIDARYLGGKALLYLTTFDRKAGDLATCRAEMRRFIGELLAVVQQDPVRPFARPEAKPAAADAAFMAELEPLETKLKAAKNKVEAGLVAGPIRKAYERHFRYEELLAKNEREGNYLSAANIAQELLDSEKARRLRRTAFEQGQIPASVRERLSFLGELLREEPALASEPTFTDAVSHGETNTNRFAGAVLNELGKRNKWMNERMYGVWTWFFNFAASCSDEATLKGVPFTTADYGIEAFAATGDFDGMRRVIALALKNGNLKAVERYQLELARALVSEETLGKRLSSADVAARVRMVEARAVADKDRVTAICAVGRLANVLNDEALVRGLDAYRKALYRPVEKKCYTVRYSSVPVEGAESWKRLAVRAEEAVYDRSYGGSLEFLATDVTTGARTTGDAKEKLPPTKMQIVTDDWGLHFRFVNDDPKAREIECGITKGGSFEMYLAPGDNLPYVCMMLTVGESRIGIFNSQYRSAAYRPFDTNTPGGCRVETEYSDDAVVCCLSIPWTQYATSVPDDGAVWNFENLSWNRTGNCAWNGAESIHGRSTWGDLVFEMPEAARARILRRLSYRAYADFMREVNGAHGYEGCVMHWKDTAVGDVTFYDQVVRPYVAPLIEQGKRLAPILPDADILALDRDGTLAKWSDIAIDIARLRRLWLERATETRR